MLALMSPETHCSRCARPFRVFVQHYHSSGVPMFTGNGVLPDGSRLCYKCCGDDDRTTMRTSDRITLYLTTEAGKNVVTNWPGTLKIDRMSIRKGRHNIARTRYDVWFRAEGKNWHGVQYGENTQLLHCRALKSA